MGPSVAQASHTSSSITLKHHNGLVCGGEGSELLEDRSMEELLPNGPSLLQQ